MLDQLRNALDVFVKRHPELSDLDNVQSYTDYEKIFITFCSEFPQFDGRLLCLFGHRPIYPNRFIPRIDSTGTDWVSILLRDKSLRDEIDELMLRDAHVEHVVWLFPGDHVVDVMYRLLDVFSEQVYNIQTLEELKQKWLLITPTRELYERFTHVDSALLQGTRAWYNKAYKETATEEGWLLHQAEQRRMARACYDSVATAFLDGTIWLPGTVDDNPHLKCLIEEWPKLLVDF
jgi:hypothetical protein